MNKRHLNYLKQRYIINIPQLINEMPFINIAAEKNKINKELLFGIIMLEVMNRGNQGLILIENLLRLIYPTYLIRNDCSVGIAQIKISTARTVLDIQDEYEILNILLDNKKAIEICAKLLYSFTNILVNKNEYIKNNNYEKMINLYLTGNVKTRQTPWIITYKKLLVWSIENKLFRKNYNRCY